MDRRKFFEMLAAIPLAVKVGIDTIKAMPNKPTGLLCSSPKSDLSDVPCSYLPEMHDSDIFVERTLGGYDEPDYLVVSFACLNTDYTKIKNRAIKMVKEKFGECELVEEEISSQFPFRTFRTLMSVELKFI